MPYLNPQTERTPAIAPTARAPPGVSIMSAHAPTATPPARVAFWKFKHGENFQKKFTWMCSISNFLLGVSRAEQAKVAITQEQRL